jgi:hypothetical protein
MIINGKFTTSQRGLSNFNSSQAVSNAVFENNSSFTITQSTAGVTITLPQLLLEQSPTLGDRVVFTNDGTVGIFIKPKGKLVFLAIEQSVAFQYVHPYWYALTDTVIDIYQATHNLVAGANTITHNLGLITPKSFIYQVYDINGNIIEGLITGQGPNSLMFTVAMPFTSSSVCISGRGSITPLSLTMSLVAGDNVIGHNFALSNPKAVIVQIVDNGTGELTDFILKNLTSNSLTITVTNALANQNVNIYR